MSKCHIVGNLMLWLIYYVIQLSANRKGIGPLVLAHLDKIYNKGIVRKNYSLVLGIEKILLFKIYM